MPRISDRWSHFGTSIFTTMTLKAQATNSINLAQGFPDFDGPNEVKKAAIDAVTEGCNQYAPAPGLPRLRQLIAARRSSQAGGNYDWAEEVTIFSGATEALFCTLQGLFGPGDEILAFEPLYDSYIAGAHSAGAKIVGVPLAPPSFSFTAAALERLVTKNTRAILVNSPHNPTGRVFHAAELAIIRDFALAHDLIVITDEVYEELVYSPNVCQSLATLPGLRDRTVVISSTAKTFSFTGWKVGYAFAPAALTKLLRAVHQFTVFCSATPLQHGMIAALQLSPEYYDDLRSDYRQRRDQLLASLVKAGFQPVVPEGSYFIIADYSKLSDQDDRSFALRLAEVCGVASIPLSPFYVDEDQARKSLRFLRFAFCKSLDTLSAAGERLLSFDARANPIG
ncbi:MAG: aminotransferase class I/II-fold pyridoxal phosphate-dependent enzyme [Deltaproteobacteria bacterium]|nr:aminotransferase class I/II-fold pyridoxal phosphate-dependent enzyme [Deltaproteobacteria bacterium]